MKVSQEWVVYFEGMYKRIIYIEGMQMSVGVDRLARAKHLPASVEPKDSALTGRLSQLEHLQYQLTKQVRSSNDKVQTPQVVQIGAR